MLHRIFLIGTGRLYEAGITLSFDHLINPKPDKTYIISPYPKETLVKTLELFNLDPEPFTFYQDEYFDNHYQLSRYKHNHWYYQQALKLCALDYFDAEYFLIQDCDQVLIKPYKFFINGKLNIRAEKLWNAHQNLYRDMITKLTGLSPVLDYSLVNELMPFTKTDWIALKQLLEDYNNCNWLDAIPNLKELDESKWFSEYELLGMYKTNQPNTWSFSTTTLQPPIYSLEDFYNHNWSNYNTVRFVNKPFKYLNLQDALNIKKYLKELTDNN